MPASVSKGPERHSQIRNLGIKTRGELPEPTTGRLRALSGAPDTDDYIVPLLWVCNVPLQTQ